MSALIELRRHWRRMHDEHVDAVLAHCARCEKNCVKNDSLASGVARPSGARLAANSVTNALVEPERHGVNRAEASAETKIVAQNRRAQRSGWQTRWPATT